MLAVNIFFLADICFLLLYIILILHVPDVCLNPASYIPIENKKTYYDMIIKYAKILAYCTHAQNYAFSTFNRLASAIADPIPNTTYCVPHTQPGEPSAALIWYKDACVIFR
jgi:hypothetical protein